MLFKLAWTHTPEARDKKIVRTGWPMEYMKEILEPFKGTEKRDLIFLTATRSNLPKNTSVRHKKTKNKLKFFLPFRILTCDGLPETIFSHSLIIFKLKSSTY